MIRPVRPDGTIETGGAFVPIPRRRVIERIATSAIQRVVLIIAPAGYGKSVALRQYLDGVPGSVVRYDLLPEHGTMLGFLRGFADAVADVAPDARATLSGAYEKNVDADNVGADLALWMDSHLQNYRGTIALDDLHIAQNEREVTRFLASLIERTKGRIAWMIASRSTQGLPIGTWLAYGESDLAVDEHDLKFSVEEAKDAARAFRLGVRDEELYELLNLTDGWATAMSFALRSSTRSVDLRSIASMTREMIYRYLAEQVYGALSEPDRELLESAALLPTIDLDVLVAAGFDRAAAMIQALRERVAFIQEPSPGTYRLHDLFREFVLHQLSLRGDAQMRAGALRVGLALESLGRFAPALRLYLQSGAREDIVRVLHLQGLHMVTKGFLDDVTTVLTPDLGSPYENDSTILGLRGLLELLRGRGADGERLLAKALRLPGASDLKSELLLRIAVHQVNGGRDAAELLETFLGKEQLKPAEHLEIESYLAVCHARFARVEQAGELSRRVNAELAGIDDGDTYARVLFRLGTVQSLLRNFDVAKPLLMQAAELATDRGLWSVASKAYLNLSVAVLFEDADTTQSLWNAQRSASAATRAGDMYDLQTALLAILSLETRSGNAAQAEEVERKLAEIRASDAQRASFILSSQAHRLAWSGRFAEAHRLFGSILDRQVHPADRATVYAMHAFCLSMDGQGRLSTDSVERSLAIIESACAPGSTRGEVQCDIAALLAIVAEVVAGRMTVAQRLLKRYRGNPDPVATAMHTIVGHLVRAGQAASYAVGDAAAELAVLYGKGFGGYAKHLERALERVGARPELEAGVVLTPSELRILQSLARGLTPKDIAVEMGRSVYTVQTHVQNVIEKLGCHGRAEAISAARQLGLIDASL